MSRAYRIKVRESLRRVIRAEDHVSSQLEILEILPAGEMAELIAAQLVERGFVRKQNQVLRKDGQVTVAVDLESGEITVRAETSQKIELKSERQGYGYELVGQRRKATENQLRDEAKAELERGAEERRSELQDCVTRQLEDVLRDLRGELDQAVNRATAEALKQKAARIGQIKQMVDDPASGSLTIVVEV